MVSVKDLRPGMRVKIVEEWEDNKMEPGIPMFNLRGCVLTVSRVISDDDRFQVEELDGDYNWMGLDVDYIVDGDDDYFDESAFLAMIT